MDKYCEQSISMISKRWIELETKIEETYFLKKQYEYDENGSLIYAEILRNKEEY